MRFLVSQSQNYPKEMYYALMNLLSSHDIARVRTVLATGEDGHDMPREAQAVFTATEEQDACGAALQRIAAAIQFSIPGIPSVYYGDEVGMTGLLDPFNRGAFVVRDEAMATWYEQLAALRQAHGAMQTGEALFYSTDRDVIGIFRYCIEDRDAFGRAAKSEALLTVVNPANTPHRIVFDLYAENDCLTLAHSAILTKLRWNRAVSLLTNSGGGTAARAIDISDGLVDIFIPPRTAEIFQLEWDIT
jgi:glycosidase